MLDIIIHQRDAKQNHYILYIYTTIYPWEWLKLKQLIISGVGKDVEQVGYLMSGDSLKVYDWELGCTCTRQDYL